MNVWQSIGRRRSRPIAIFGAELRYIICQHNWGLHSFISSTACFCFLKALSITLKTRSAAAELGCSGRILLKGEIQFGRVSNAEGQLYSKRAFLCFLVAWLSIMSTKLGLVLLSEIKPAWIRKHWKNKVAQDVSRNQKEKKLPATCGST